MPLKKSRSVHRDCGEKVDWGAIRHSGPPEAPQRSSRNESAATLALEAFRPSFFQKLFKKDEAEVALLESKVLYAAKQDEDEYQRAYESYLEKHQEWSDQVA